MKSGGRDGSSQVGVVAAMRARDVARPTDEQLADAERAERGYPEESSTRGGSTPEAS